MINLNLYVNYSEKSTKIVSRSPSPMHSILNNDSSNCLSSNSNSQMSSKSSKLPSLLTSHSSSSTSSYQTTINCSNSNLPKKKSGLPMKGCINTSNNKIATPISTNSLVNNNQSQAYQQQQAQQCSQALNSINKLHQISKIQQPQTTNNQQSIDSNKPSTKYVHIVIIRLD